MKSIIYANLLIATVLFFTSCKKQESKVLSGSSKDGKMHIAVRGERMTSMDPFTVFITLTHNGQDLEVTTEVYADKIDESNVKFKWQDERHCLVVFTHRDGKKNIVPVGVNE